MNEQRNTIPPPYNPGRFPYGGQQPGLGVPPSGGNPPGQGYGAPHAQPQPQPQPGYFPQYPPYQGGYPPPQQPWQPYIAGQRKSNGMGVAGFILAVLSVFIGWIPLIGWLVWILGAIFSFIGLFHQPRGLAIAGVIISLVLIPTLISILVAIDAFTSAMFLL